MYQSAEDIIEHARRIPFTDGEIRSMIEAVKVRRAKGTDLSFGYPPLTPTKEDALKAADEGIVFLLSLEQLKTAFLFLKLDAGKSIFGGQKAVYASYLCTDLTTDGWEAGPTFKSWLIGLTSIGNIYRSEGYK